MPECEIVERKFDNRLVEGWDKLDDLYEIIEGKEEANQNEVAVTKSIANPINIIPGSRSVTPEEIIQGNEEEEGKRPKRPSSKNGRKKRVVIPVDDDDNEIRCANEA